MNERKGNTKQTTITVAGIDVVIIKKKIKNRYIRILRPDGTVVVSVPLRTSDREARQFVEEHLSWIRMKQTEVKENVAEQPKHFVSGEIHYVWGKPFSLRIVESSGRMGVKVSENQLIMFVPEDSTQELREKLLDNWYRGQMQVVLEPLLNECETIVGKTALECRIKKMKTKWGTCNVNARRIWLNLRLAKLPPECLRYVMIHELTHLYVRGHNGQFYAYLDRFCPDWKSIEKSMK